MEIWKDIKGFEGVYQVSNTGKVRRLIFRNNHVVKNKIIEKKPTDNGNGYLIVNLQNGNKRKNYYVHRLVAEAFCEKPINSSVVNHKDYNKYNNGAENLEWCTQKLNVIYSSERMKHEKKKCKATNTGEKYIQKRNKRYCVSISRLKVYKSFSSLEEAIAFRNEVLINGL